MIYRQSTSSVPTPSLAIAYALKKSSAQLNFGSLRKTTEEKAKNVGLNAILLEGVRGEYDETGLKGLLKPIMRGQIFRVEWTVRALPLLPLCSPENRPSKTCSSSPPLRRSPPPPPAPKRHSLPPSSPPSSICANPLVSAKAQSKAGTSMSSTRAL